MRWNTAAVLFAWTCVASLSMPSDAADDPVLPRLVSVTPQPAPVPDASTVNVPAPAEPAVGSPLDQVQILLDAGAQLEALGRHELAREVRLAAEDVLAKEQSRLAAIQLQLDALTQRAVANREPMVRLQMVLVEVDRQASEQVMKTLLSGFGGRANLGDNGHFVTYPETVTQADIVRVLEESGAKHKILGRPQVITTNHRPARITLGKEVPLVSGVTTSPDGTTAPVKSPQFVGIEIAMVPEVTESGEMEIQIHAERSELSGKEFPIFTAAATGEVTMSQVLNIGTLASLCEVADGGLIVLTNTLWGRASWAEEGAEDAAAESSLFIVIAPQVVEDTP
jgi:hypothetical protein